MCVCGVFFLSSLSENVSPTSIWLRASDNRKVLVLVGILGNSMLFSALVMH